MEHSTAQTFCLFIYVLRSRKGNLPSNLNIPLWNPFVDWLDLTVVSHNSLTSWETNVMDSDGCPSLWVSLRFISHFPSWNATTKRRSWPHLSYDSFRWRQTSFWPVICISFARQISLAWKRQADSNTETPHTSSSIFQIFKIPHYVCIYNASDASKYSMHFAHSVENKSWTLSYCDLVYTSL